MVLVKFISLKRNFPLAWSSKSPLILYFVGGQQRTNERKWWWMRLQLNVNKGNGLSVSQFYLRRILRFIFIRRLKRDLTRVEIFSLWTIVSENIFRNHKIHINKWTRPFSYMWNKSRFNNAVELKTSANEIFNWLCDLNVL